MRWIYISPHFDDAVLSCGGLIWEQSHSGTPVEIWTVCGGDAQPGPLSELALVCHQVWGFSSSEEVLTARRLENQNAAALVGAETVDFGIPDCIYRHSPTGELLYPEQVFAPIHPVDRNLYSDISTALAGELRPDDIVVGPLAVGGHVDHVLTRHAVEHLGLPVKYYADIPYLLDHPEQLASATRALRPLPNPVTKKGLAAWKKGIASYRSQILMLFQTRENMDAAISGYWENEHALQLWQSADN
jgi:LmbE family N-acetylglucosaminyl deacetylase